jgi:NAD(P)-dependent dehydrogenase (short-subunit alcohol dehydrogenase family)
MPYRARDRHHDKSDLATHLDARPRPARSRRRTRGTRARGLKSVAEEVTAASDAHRSARLDLDDLHSEKSYSPRVYGTSKLCNILFTRELARRAPELHANCFHPGVVRTGFARNENG